MTSKDRFPRLFSAGAGAVCVEFGDCIDAAANDLANRLTDELTSRPFRGFVESVPGYSSATVFYDVYEAFRAYPQYATTYDAVADELRRRVRALKTRKSGGGRRFEIPVLFGRENGPDLDDVADRAGLSIAETIAIFTSTEYRVFMIGFLPGFPYLASVDERIAASRRSSPRTLVPRGSVGIAGLQTGIYPVDSPGGWQIIGRTDFNCFESSDNPPSRLSPGDLVKFVAT